MCRAIDRRRQVAAVQPGGIVGQIANAQVGDRPARQPLEEPPHVAAIGGDRVVGQMALAPQVLEETFDPAAAGGPACNRYRLEHSAWGHDVLAVEKSGGLRRYWRREFTGLGTSIESIPHLLRFGPPRPDLTRVCRTLPGDYASRSWQARRLKAEAAFRRVMNRHCPRPRSTRNAQGLRA